jgi:HSP20 family molecular chaperone IbpA
MTDVATYRLFRPLAVCQRDLDRSSADFLLSLEKTESGEYPSAIWLPRLHLSEAEADYVISMDLLPVSKEEVQVSSKEGRPTVGGKREREYREATTACAWSANTAASFARSSFRGSSTRSRSERLLGARAQAENHRGGRVETQTDHDHMS